MKKSKKLVYTARFNEKGESLQDILVRVITSSAPTEYLKFNYLFEPKL